MKKTISILIILMLIGVASAAVYIAINSEAKVYFGIDKPASDGSPIESMVEIQGSGWTNAYGATVIDNVVEFQMWHRNTHSEPLNGTLNITLHCNKGFTFAADGSILDFDTILFTTPTYDGVDIECNTPDIFSIIDDYTIELNPITEEIEFGTEIDSYKFNYIHFGLNDDAYGDYTVTILVTPV